jgi:glucose-1-phosphate cytidylyltransferase
VDLVDTGQRRHRRSHQAAAPHLGDETFLLTWGDGVSTSTSTRSSPSTEATASWHPDRGPAARPLRPPRDRRGPHRRVLEKPQVGRGVDQRRVLRLEPEVFDYIDGDDTMFEREPLERSPRTAS